MTTAMRLPLIILSAEGADNSLPQKPHFPLSPGLSPHASLFRVSAERKLQSVASDEKTRL
jgi:hypothetical protein